MEGNTSEDDAEVNHSRAGGTVAHTSTITRHTAAPLPALFADFGLLPFQARLRMRPIGGNRKPRAAQAKPPLSTGVGSEENGLWRDRTLVAITGTGGLREASASSSFCERGSFSNESNRSPHSGQVVAPSSTAVPHFLHTVMLVSLRQNGDLPLLSPQWYRNGAHSLAKAVDKLLFYTRGVPFVLFGDSPPSTYA